MTPAERAARLDADMAAFQQLGVNTVLGWDPAEFDDVLLAAAERHGIGVVMPFDLDPEADYTDPAVRQTPARRGDGLGRSATATSPPCACGGLATKCCTRSSTRPGSGRRTRPANAMPRHSVTGWSKPPTRSMPSIPIIR